jgi:glycosyltransferase involved in cell wall biosynthesis
MSKNSLRLLLVGTYPPPFGGIATHFVSLVPGLKSMGAENIAIVSFKDEESVIENRDFTLYNYNVKKQTWCLLNPFEWPLFLMTIFSLGKHGIGFKTIVIESVKAILVNRIAKKHSSNVASFYQSNLHFEIIPLSKLWKKRRAIVLTVFGEYYENTELLNKFDKLFCEILETPSYVTSSSRHCASSFKMINVEREIEPVYYGVNLSDVTSLELRRSFRESHNIAEADTLVLFMGRFSVEMGFDSVLGSVPALLQNNSTIKFLFAGQRAELSDKAEELAGQYPENVFIIHNVPFNKQSEIFSASDLLLAPTFNQRACMGMAIKEAMAAGLAVIGSNGGGISEAIVDDETGFLIDLDINGMIDKESFVEKIKFLVDNPEVRKNYGDRGRVRAENIFSVEKTNAKMMEIFLKVKPQK